MKKMAHIEDDKAQKRCALPGCSCLMQDDEEYCSEACEKEAGRPKCACGHLACEAEAAAVQVQY